MLKRPFLLLPFSFLLFTFNFLHPQAIPTHLSNEGIYLFLDELATSGIFDLNSPVKPYSRSYISEKLIAADSLRNQLTPRQSNELNFYLRDYGKDLSSGKKSNPKPVPGTPYPETYWLWQKKGTGKRVDAFYYTDSFFSITVNPIVGGSLWTNRNEAFYHWWNGAEAWATAGKFGFWASLRDNHESVPLTNPDFMNQQIGGSNYKLLENGKRDFEEFRGGVTYAWKWGHTGIIMDQFSWGENNHGSNILSGRTPAFARLELSLQPARWFEFQYVHGWLNSEVVDSARSFYTSASYGTDYREVYHSKFLAANLFTFIPIKSLRLSVGNSIIYDYRNLHIAYLVPITFFKAIDHALNARIDNMNSQLFFSASSRNLRYFHFYGSIFIDELQVGRIFKKDEHNFVSYKAGVSSTIIPNGRAVFEYTWTNALTFMHMIPTTTFESNHYNLGHYLEDNARDLYATFEYRPWRTLNIKTYYNHSIKGPDHTELGTLPRSGIQPFEPVVWKSIRVGINATFQILNDLYARLGYEWCNVTGEQDLLDRWTPSVYHGKTGTLNIGLNYGF